MPPCVRPHATATALTGRLTTARETVTSWGADDHDGQRQRGEHTAPLRGGVGWLERLRLARVTEHTRSIERSDAPVVWHPLNRGSRHPYGLAKHRCPDEASSRLVGPSDRLVVPAVSAESHRGNSPGTPACSRRRTSICRRASTSRPHRVVARNVTVGAGVHLVRVPGCPVLHGCVMIGSSPGSTPSREFYTSPGSAGKRFSRCAAAAACRRFDTPNFAMMWETWTLTVLSVMNSRLAICWFE